MGLDQAAIGLYEKFTVHGVNGKAFVLDLDHDRHAPLNLTPNTTELGLTVVRNDGRSRAGEKHYHCRYYVIRVDVLAHAGERGLLGEQADHDRDILARYAANCATDYPLLAADIRAFLDGTKGFLE